MIRHIAFAASLFAAAPALAETMTMIVGQVAVIKPGQVIGAVAVADAKVADVQVEGDSTVVVLARKPGQTQVMLLDANRDVLSTTTVQVFSTSISTGVTVRRATDKGMVDERLVCAPGLPCAKEEKETGR